MGDEELNRRGELAAGEATVSMSAQEFAAHAANLRTWGQFRLLEKVGQGSFGEVYRAFDTVLEREVALKLLLPGTLPQGEEASALGEARSLAKVRHPNVVQVYGVDRHDGRPGFWSDFVHGRTLSALLAAQGPFGPREVALIGIDLGKALSAVHAARLLHRDIKASNVMREEGGRILLMDFGLTHNRDAKGPVSGTVPYMAPELLRGEPASAASDIYAAGVLLYYLLAGKHPFREGSPAALKAAYEAGVRPRLMDDRPDLPEPLTRVIETAMDPDPQKRYATAGEMIAALSGAAGLSAAAGSEGVAAAPAKRRGARWLVAALIALAFTPEAYLALRRRAPRASAQSGPASESAQRDYLKAQDLLDHYYKPHNIDNAVALFQKTTGEDPAFASAYAGLGRALWVRYGSTHDPGQIEPAKAACSRAIELDPEIASPHATLGRIYSDEGRVDVAAEELKKALALNGRSADAYSALAELYQKEGRTAEVEPTIQKAVDLAPDQWPWLNQLGIYYLLTGNYRAAAQQFQQALTLNPDNAHAWNNLGLAYSRQNRLADAQAAYQKSLGIETAFGPLSNLGMILEVEGKDAEAVDIYRRAVGLNPSSYLSWANLASAQNRIAGGGAEARETYLKAISVAEEARAKTPDDAAIAADLGSFYAGVGMAEKSAPLLRQASALAPDDPQILYRVAEGYELLHRREDALHWIARAFSAGLARETVDRNPELAALRADPKFPARTARK